MAMLACARIGAVHSVVFGGFAAAELATRIDDAQPEVVMSASCGIEPSRVVEYKPLLDRAIEMSTAAPEHCVILQRPQADAPMMPGRDLDWVAHFGAAQPADCVPVSATDPLYLLYASGTTGAPKGVVRDNGGHAAALEWSMTCLYDVAPERPTGRRRTSAGSSDTPTSSMYHSFTAAQPLSTRASPSVPRARERFGGSSPSTKSRCCSPPRRRSGLSNGRIPTVRTWRRTPCPASVRSSSR